MTLIEAVASKKPKRILLSLGTNSVATMEIDYFITKYEELLKQTKDKYEIKHKYNLINEDSYFNKNNSNNRK